MPRYTPILVILIATHCIAAAPAAIEDKPDKDRIQGIWQLISWQNQGKEAEIPAGLRLVITADAIIMVKEKEKDKSSFNYTIDPSNSPKEMEWIIELDPKHPIHQPAIYSLDGDMLKICVTAAGKPRPSKFESKKGGFETLWVLKRLPNPPSK